MVEPVHDSGERPAAKTSFRVSTYWKRRRSEPGLTSMASERLDLAQALSWVLREIPEDARLVKDGGNVTTIVIDWSKVPPEIAAGTS